MIIRFCKRYNCDTKAVESNLCKYKRCSTCLDSKYMLTVVMKK